MEDRLRKGDFQKIECIAEEMIEFTPLHSSMYSLDEKIPEKIYSGLIVVVEDYKLKTNIIIDGNHRRNTLIKYAPNQDVVVILVQGDLSFLSSKK